MIASLTLELVQIHLLQSTLALLAGVLATYFTAKRWPRFTYVLLVLLLLKCIVPPIIPSPAGIFTLSDSVAFTAESRSASSYAWQSLTADGPLYGSESAGLSPLAMVPFILCGVWIAGASVVLLRSVRGMRLFWQRLHATASLPSASVLRLVHQVKARLGIGSQVKVLISDDNLGPGCIGLFRPKLILPRVAIQNLPDKLLLPILAHELVHVRRRDVAWGYLQFLTQVVLWFHPLVWWAARRANMVCERCVDEEVISRLGCSKADYGESLVQVLQFKRVLRPIPVGRQISAAEVTSKRLEHLFGVAANAEASAKSSFLGFCGLALLAVLILPGATWTESRSKPTWSDLKLPVTQLMHQNHWNASLQLLAGVELARLDATSRSEVEFLLGCTQLELGKYEKALWHFQVAAEDEEVRGNALVLGARAAAMLGDADASVEIIGQLQATDIEALMATFGASEFGIANSPLVATVIRRVENTRGNSATDSYEYWIETTGEFGTQASKGIGSSVPGRRSRGRPQLNRRSTTEARKSPGTDIVDLVSTAINGKQIVTRTTLYQDESGKWQQRVDESSDGGVTWRQGGGNARKSQAENASLPSENPLGIPVS